MNRFFLYLFVGVQSLGFTLGAEEDSSKIEIAKPKVHSFDVFDTLIGRLQKDPKSIFRIVEKKYPYPGFYNLRIEAECRSNRSIEDIYQQMIVITGMSKEEAEKLQAFEFTTELENVFPINCNLSQVQEGDILVSDTCYNSDKIRELVTRAGLNKKVEIFAAPGGKWSGYIWPLISNRYQIISHLGDNPRSDVESCKNAGIEGKLFTDCDYSQTEKIVFDAQHESLANLMRALRLSNPYPVNSIEHKIWEEQAQLNVPILILASLYIDDYSKKNEYNRILFSSRDCCHLIHIFKALFPQYESIYFYTSRRAYYYVNPYYYEYVRTRYFPKALIVDGFGSGTSCYKFFELAFPGVIPAYLPIVSAHFYRVSDAIVGISKEGGDTFEKMNYANEGSLLCFSEKGPVLLPVEYNVEYLKPTYACMKQCVQLLSNYEFGVFNQALIDQLLTTLKQKGCVLEPYMTHSPNHDPTNIPNDQLVQKTLMEL